MDDNLALFGAKISSLVAGFAGAALSLTYIRQLNHRTAAIAQAGGLAAAVFLAPAIITFFHLPEDVEGAVYFLVGLLGLNVLAAIAGLIDIARADPKGMLHGLIQSWRGLGGPKK
ncbi:MAG: hypothetical protein Q9M33_13410 [Robiginitomaculum sp.]|nr:hypothetical protein [Robiginitomaculum sp.]